MTDLSAWLGQGVDAVAAWQRSFAGYPEHPCQQVDPDRFRAAFAELTERLTNDNYPFFHPDYAGQMLKPPHPVAVAGYLTAMLVNPNNHAQDGGPATARMEREAVAALATMFGFDTHLGHLTGGGTVANLEALFVARESHPGRGVAYSAESHYTHARMCHVLGMSGHAVPVDAAGRMDLDALDALLARGEVGTVVLTAGTTGLGAVDPIHEALALRERHGVRLHVDAAYGGFFTLLGEEESVDPRAVARDRPLRLGGRRPAQARPAALRVRRGAVRRPVRGPLLPPRLALHLLHRGRPAPRRDQPGVLAGRRRGGGAVADVPGDPADAATVSAASSRPAGGRRWAGRS